MLRKVELSCEADSENYLGGSSRHMYYIGLDVHKKTISYCVKDAAGRLPAATEIPSKTDIHGDAHYWGGEERFGPQPDSCSSCSICSSRKPRS